ncbi:MAG: 50S ribosome-binding GTPase [Candidatus Omnitrophica bacterium]|nr:50S ribosome-binding GTPase [Candidatus Omnitrophota bacterium]MCM8816003.1 50S ribosome-binding GTPase [Candidatus Omnitrophota bacterium]
MVANLPPHYHTKEAELKKAKTPEEKIEILLEMMAIMPKHKGTEKLQKELKSKIAKLRKEAAEKKIISRGSPVPVIVREGAGQVIIAGPANTGKSSLLASMTKAKPEIADYPYTTKIPQPGMFQYQDIQIQMIDTPALASGISENWLGDMMRKADLIMILIDLSDDDILEKMEDAMNVLEQFRIKTEKKWEFNKKIMWVGNKIDVAGWEEIKEVVCELYPIEKELIPISVKENINLEEIGNWIFKKLEIIRVYTKIPGKPAEMKDPYTIAANSTLEDLARAIHKDLVKSFRYARLWKQGQGNPLIAGRDHILEDRDLVEIHAEEIK